MSPGVVAPSGVVMIGLALVLRDLIQRRLGATWALVAIGVGALVLGVLSPPALVLASTGAFVLSELADLGIYTPLQRRGLVRAVVASSAVGVVVDSIVFLLLALGSLGFLLGQVIGKAWMIALAVPVITWLRERDGRLGIPR